MGEKGEEEEERGERWCDRRPKSEVGGKKLMGPCGTGMGGEEWEGVEE